MFYHMFVATLGAKGTASGTPEVALISVHWTTLLCPNMVKVITKPLIVYGQALVVQV